MLRLLGEHDLDRWLFTREIVVRSFVKPHSHPTLTLNTRQLEDDEGLLGTFLHEQFHWFAVARAKCVEAATEEFRTMFPWVPVGDADGAKDERSSYLHLIICSLEFAALELLLGRERACQVVSGRPYYRWIYRKVAEDERSIRQVLERHELSLPVWSFRSQ